jgi:hypothetical protein
VNDPKRNDGDPNEERNHEEKTLDQIKSHGLFTERSFYYHKLGQRREARETSELKLEG